MTGSIRLYVTAPLAAGEIVQPRPRRRIISQLSCAAPPAIRSACSTAATGSSAARIEALRRDRAALRVEQHLRAQAPEPDLWLLFALLKRDATDLVVQQAHRTWRGGPASGHHRAQQHASDERRTAVRDRHRGRRAVRTPDRPSSASAISADCALAEWPSNRRLFAALERSDAPLCRQRPRCRFRVRRVAGRSGRRLRAGRA